MKITAKSAILSAAISGLFLGATATTLASTLTSCKSDNASTANVNVDKHACAKLNSCKGKGGCKSGDQGCNGKNTCEKKGGCATAEKHGCAKQNSCKGQGGCKSGDQGCAGKNTCAKKGGCAVPVKAEHK